MKKSHIFHMCALCIILASSWISPIAKAEKPAQPDAAQAYILYLTPPDFNQVDVPAGLRREQALRQADAWIESQARPLLHQLSLQQQRGEILGYQYQPENFAVSVRLPANSPPVDRVLGDLAEVREVLPESDQALACGAVTADQVRMQFVSISAARAVSPSAPATDPSVYAVAPNSFDPGMVLGITQPEISVTLSVRRNGVTLASSTTTSRPDGWYLFVPVWTNKTCSGGGVGYDWTLQAGDVVEVSAHGSLASTTVAPLSAWLDPATNKLIGITAAGRTVETLVSSPSAAQWCSWLDYTKIVVSGADGSFQADFTSSLDVKNYASAAALVYDPDGNGTMILTGAYSLDLNPVFSDFWGYLRPNLAYTVELSRSGLLLETTTGTAGPDGYYDGILSTKFMAGDTLRVIAGEINIGFYIAPFWAGIDILNNQVNGNAYAGRMVEVDFEKNVAGRSPIPTTCSAASDCRSAVAGIGGSFSLTSSLDLERADQLYYYVYDELGNYQYQGGAVAAVMADTVTGEVKGYWFPNEDITVTMRDLSNTLVASSSLHVTDSNGYFSTYLTYISPFPVVPKPGYTILVSDGVLGETMSVDPVTVVTDAQADRLAGTAALGKLLAELRDYNLDSGETEIACKVIAHPEGVYEIGFAAEGIEARDDAYVYHTGVDGHYTRSWGHAFYLYAEYRYGFIQGYTPLPGVPVKVELLQGDGTPLESIDVESTPDGYFSTYVGAFHLLAGQRVRVTSGTYVLDISLPDLSIHMDPELNRIYGTTVPSTWNEVYLREFRPCSLGGDVTSCFVDLARYVFSDDQGAYSLDLKGLLYEDCSPANVGAQCTQAFVTYTPPDEHDLVYITPYVSDTEVPPDEYENDDLRTSAVLYSGSSAHNFHAAGDVDWIKFTVSEAQVGKQFSLLTYNLGAKSNTILDLSDADANLLATNDDFGGSAASRIDWTPPSAGTYFVKIRPASAANTASCRATYRFMITSERVFLPVIRR